MNRPNPIRFDITRRAPPRDDLLAIMGAALAAVDPYEAVRRALRREGTRLVVGEQPYELERFARIWVVGGGKAGAPMAQAVEEVLGERLTGGTVVVKAGHLAPTQRIDLREAAHPVPDARGLAAGEALLAVARAATADDLVICLLSGGGSALLEALPAPLTLDDLQRTTSALLASGATINEMNAVRKHLSGIKGGQLARAVAPATLVSLVLSDVVGSPLDVIASGPTVPDRSTWQEANAVIERYGLGEQLPRAVVERLAQGARGVLAETPKAGDPLFQHNQLVLVGDNARAATAAAQAAEARGYHALILTTFLEGEAREVAKLLVALARELQTHHRPASPPACLILGGETTVTLHATSGKGGRNQEIALAAALLLAGTRGITIATLATDGGDGPTDAAGGIVDGESAALMTALGLEPAEALAQHNAYPLLAASGDLLRTGPTQTNVNDLLFVMVEG